MASYPIRMTLPYRVGSAWRETRILDGDLVDAVQERTIELDRLDTELRQRAVAIYRQVNLALYGDETARAEGGGTRHSARGKLTVEVVGSGVVPYENVPADARIPDVAPPRQTDYVTDRIGLLAQLPEPAAADAELIAAYEDWLRRYQDLSSDALGAWLRQYAPPHEFPSMDPEDGERFWLASASYVTPRGEHRRHEIDGRVDLDRYRRVRAANQLYTHVRMTVDSEDFEEALDILGGEEPRLDGPTDEQAVAAYAEHNERVAAIAFARFWNRHRQREGFDLEMFRWAWQHGSERLQLGLVDGYRMTPVYLQERLQMELPGFYAFQLKPGETRPWQARTGPSEAALKLRRGVQDRLDRQASGGRRPLEAQIAWMKNLPRAMIDFARDFIPVRPDDDPRGFEVIVVAGWLDRYSLIGVVWSDVEELRPPKWLQLRFALKQLDYGLTGLPEPPDVVSQARGGAAPPDDDIPF
jgi:hypothetical protein